jgi:hypothetical protein
MLPIDKVPVDDRAEVGLGEFARIAERGGKVGGRTGVGGYLAGLLDVQRHGIHHVHLVPELGQWGRIRAGAAADVQYPRGRRGQQPLQQLQRPDEL